MGQRRDDEAWVGDAGSIEGQPVSRQDADSGALAAGTVLSERYEVRAVIGRGGMGLVVEAFDRTLEVTVAIKIVRAALADERAWNERLVREVKLARQIQHPNVCRVFDFAQVDGRAFLIMDLASGGTLRDEIGNGTTRARSLRDRIADARALAAGLSAIHAAGIVHRDISPHNALRMGDGRLVLSDFGLATDSFDGTSSIHGGTVAYMAPEVVRGGRADVAADLWSLGAVIHEVVFGERLRWDPRAAEMRSPVGEHALSPIERSVFELCRACLAADPARRPSGAAEIAARLSDVGLARSAGRRARRRALLALAAVAAVVLVVLVVLGARRIEASRRDAARFVAARLVDPLLLTPQGEPDDWTESSKVLAELPDQVRCMVRLPDHRSLRLLWGYPARAEDIDTRTGLRTPSPLVPDAYAEGCPDLTSDGKRLVYTGHTADDRAFAFVSEHADGRGAVPVVPIAEPTLASDPTWLPDGERFLYDVDMRHVALFSVATKRSLVLPDDGRSYVSSFHDVVGDQVFSTSADGLLVTAVHGYTPSLDELVAFRLPGLIIRLDDAGAGRYFCSMEVTRTPTPLIEVDPVKREARPRGLVRGQSVSSPRIVDDGLAFLSRERTAEIVRSSGDGTTKLIPVGPEIVSAAGCGDGLLATRIASGGPTLVRLGPDGRVEETLGPDRGSNWSACSPDGKILYYVSISSEPGLRRCEKDACRLIVPGLIAGFSLSPLGDRVALFVSSNGGTSVQWMRADGSGHPRQIVETSAVCTPQWSSDENLWVAIRRGRKVIWTELNVASGTPTGRTSVGSRDCSDGTTNPLQPVRPGVSLQTHVKTQLRLLPARDLRSTN